MKIYNDATKKHFDFLKIPVDERDEDKRYNINWNQFYQIENDSNNKEKIINLFIYIYMK